MAEENTNKQPISTNIILKAGQPIRWHDKDEEVARLVQMLRELPEEYQDMIARILSGAVEEWQQSKSYDQSRSVSLGVDKHLALWKSKSKRRWYDKHPSMHRAMNHLLVLDDDQRRYMAEKLNPALSAVQKYMDICLEHQRPSINLELSQIIRLSMEQGEDVSFDYIQSIAKLSSAPPMKKPYHVHQSQGELRVSSMMNHPAKWAPVHSGMTGRRSIHRKDTSLKMLNR
jgi:hypothetical protein